MLSGTGSYERDKEYWAGVARQIQLEEARRERAYVMSRKRGRPKKDTKFEFPDSPDFETHDQRD